jgi:hypothetical protein
MSAAHAGGTPATRLARFLIVLGLASLTTLSGCTAFAYIVAQFAPPRKVKAITELPKDKTILVYVESEQPLSYEPIKDMLTDELNKELLINKVAGAAIPRERLLEVAANFADASVSKQEIGRKLHADLILSVEIESFSVRESDDTPLWAGKMKVSLKVIDVGNVKKLWPLDQTEYPVPLIELPEAEDSTATYGNIVARALAIKTARRIAKLFYEHEIPNVGPED